MTEDLVPDPKLISAWEEIEAVCRKHDVAAQVFLNSRMGGEVRMHVPTWSLWREEAPGKYQLRHKGKNTPEFEATVAMIFSLRDIFVKNARALERMCTVLETQATIIHDPVENRIIPPKPKLPENVN